MQQQKQLFIVVKTCWYSANRQNRNGEKCPDMERGGHWMNGLHLGNGIIDDLGEFIKEFDGYNIEACDGPQPW